ncbi:FAD-dependent oxidoreductase [Brachybacterium sp. YJGR34]|uniref:FAD-dependent oxidoreductase n=1 Tax=Brachybacterium sp. YJGR34 TaxID=2059911 RepID=UPI000E0A9F43|nr:FAD-dependent oxidoreductase [Brachybacterium sp. YJGR34]
MSSLWLDMHEGSQMPTDALPGRASVDVAVAGGGLTGLATAVALARTGRRVIVLEARTVGAVATGNTTAKLSLLQGARLSEIRRRHALGTAAAYLTASRAAQDWLLELCRTHRVEVQRRDAVSYAVGEAGARRLRAEQETARALGLPARWEDSTELPFPVAGALSLAEQAQFDPMEVLLALAQELRERGGMIVDGARLTDVAGRDPLTVSTTRGTVHADRLVLATGVPVLGRGGHALRMVPHRSYALAYRVPESGWVPRGMHVSVDAPVRSLRSARYGDEELLLVGGNDHVTGRAEPAAAVQELDTWARSLVPGIERTHWWAAQDYESASGLPLIGALPGSGGRILASTGYAKWGMTSAVVGALAVTGTIEDRPPSWLGALRSAGGGLPAVAAMAALTAAAGREAMTGWAGAALRPLPSRPPSEGEGVVGRRGARPVAVSTVDGRTCAVSGVCTHLAGVLRWNDAEHTWDCPLHGSRFSAEGALLEGPAVKDLGTEPL